MIMRALCAALAVDLIVLPSVGVPGLVTIEGGVLRYEARARPKLLRRAIREALERYSTRVPSSISQ